MIEAARKGIVLVLLSRIDPIPTTVMHRRPIVSVFPLLACGVKDVELASLDERPAGDSSPSRDATVLRNHPFIQLIRPDKPSTWSMYIGRAHQQSMIPNRAPCLL